MFWLPRAKNPVAHGSHGRSFCRASPCPGVHVQSVIETAPGNTKMLTICLPLYGEDGSPIVTYHSDPALSFYRYVKEDTSSRSRGSAAT